MRGSWWFVSIVLSLALTFLSVERMVVDELTFMAGRIDDWRYFGADGYTEIEGVETEQVE